MYNADISINILAALMTALGLIFGSFANVVIYRLPRKESIVFPPSKCPACSHPIKPYDNIPLFSFILLRGSCRNCGSRIPTIYPIVELLAALLAAGLFLKFGLSVEFAGLLVFGFLLLIVSAIDIHKQLIPNTMVFILSAVGIVFAMVSGSFLASMAWALGLFLLMLAVALVKPGSMGMGDVKLTFAIGMFLGHLGTVALFSAFLFGSVISGVLIVFFGKSRKDRVPFAPFMAAGSMAAIFFGQEVIRWYLGFFPG